MRLISVDIQNFRVIRSAHLDFPDHLIGIIGPNGSGKSTLIEAVSWGLYGHQVARSGKEEIKASFARPSDPCEVSLSFEVRGEIYRVVRRLVGKSEKSEVELYRGAASESIGVSETRSYVGNLLGLDWRGFLTSFLARQSELNALTSLAPSKRREHLAGMLGIERLDKALQRVKDDSRLDEERVALISRQLAARESTEYRVAELREHVSRLEHAVQESVGASQQLSTELAIALDMLREHQGRFAICSRLDVEIEAQGRSRVLLEEQVERLELELHKLGAASGEIAGLERRLGRIEPVKDELEELRTAQRQSNLRAETDRQIGLLGEEVNQTTNRLEEISQQISRIAAGLAELPESMASEFEQLKAELHVNRDEQTRLQTQKEGLIKEERRLQSQLADLGDFGPDAVCDRCHRPFRVDELGEFKEHIQAELAGVRKQVQALDIQIGEATERGHYVRSEANMAEQRLAGRADLLGEQRVLEAEQKELRERLVKCADQMKFLEGQLVELGEVAFDPKRFQELQAELVELDAAQARLNQLQGSLGRVAVAEAELQGTQGKLAMVRLTIDQLRQQANETGFDSAALEAAQKRFEEAQRAASAAHEEHLRQTHELDLTRQELTLKGEQLAEFGRAMEELEATRTRQFYSEALSRLFSDFRKYLIASIRPRLAELTGQLLGDMTADRYSLVELDEDYNLSIYDYGQFYKVERFSGGESDLANLCLRLAISLSLTESAGLERSFIILDEVFGSQDETRRELVFEGLASLKGRFPQILLITHFEELKHKVETLIEVVPTAQGWSDVRVNGALA